MDLLETRVLPDSAMDQNENEGKENHIRKENPFREQQQQSDPSAKKQREFLSLGGDSGDLVESVAMDLISRQAENMDDLHNHHHHHRHQQQQQQLQYHHHHDTTAVVPAVNSMSSVRPALEPVAGSSSSRCVSRLTDPDLNHTSMCQRLLRVPTNGDKRLASSYTSFVLGRILSIAGSTLLLIGLFFRFIFMSNDGPAKSILFTVIGASIIMIVIGATLVIWSAHKSQVARKLHDQDLLPNPKPGRPDSGLSSASFH